MSVRPPTSVQVGHVRYAVVLDGQFLDDADTVHGLCSIKHQRIVLHPEQGADQLRESTLHELMHAIIRGNGLGELSEGDAVLDPAREERVIASVAPILLDMLRRNPRLVAYLTAVTS